MRCSCWLPVLAALCLSAGTLGPLAAWCPGEEDWVSGEELASAPPEEMPAEGLVRSQDQLFLVSTRHLHHWPAAAEPLDVEVQAYREEGGWSTASLAEFSAAGEPPRPTIIYVHGNRANSYWAHWKAQTMYRNLVGDFPDLPAVRFVLWSWPSDQIRGQLTDVRVKARRTVVESQYLAWFLAQCPDSTPLNLIGYSYGAAVISGALHAQLAQELPVGPPVNVVLYAAAFRHDELFPGGRFEQAPARMDRLLVIYNSCDPVLRNYYLVECARRRQRVCFEALGFTGLAARPLYGPPASIEQWNASGVIGRTHEELGYLTSPGVLDRIRRTVLPEN